MWQYHITIYEKNLTSSVSIESLAETFKVDEALDSAVLVIPRSTRKEQYKRFSPVKIEVSDGTNSRTTYWLIYTPKTELSAKGTTPLFDHTLGLIEPTKWLEKFPIGTLTFTQPLGGTRYTMAGVVERIRLLSPFVRESKIDTTRVFSVDSTLNTYLSLINAPQFYLDKKNLREALIQVFKYINAIPRMIYNGTSWILTADFVNKRQLPINIEQNIIDYGNESSGEFYSQKAEIFHENTIPIENDSITSTYETSITDAIVFKSQDIIVGDSNAKIILTNNCYKLLSIKAFINVKTGGNNTLTLVDMTSYVVEKKVWDTYDIGNTATQLGTKNCSAYWNYASNIIDGFTEFYAIFGNETALKNILDSIIQINFAGSTTDTTFDTISFLVEYITYLESSRSEQYREDTTDYKLLESMRAEYSTIQLNPQERINSLFNLTGNVYGQIQRLGVDTVSISKKHKTVANYNGSNDGIFNLGDYTEDGFYVVVRELVYFNGFIIARYELSRNFNRIAQFVQIDREYRPYEIVLTRNDFTLKRNITFPIMFIEVSNQPNDNHNNNAFLTAFMQTFGSGSYETPFSAVVLKRRQGNDFTPPASFLPDENVLMPITISFEKNTIVYQFSFNNTKLAGNRVVKRVSAPFESRQLQTTYTFANGTLEYARIQFYKSYWNIKAQTDLTNTNYAKSTMNIFRRFPYVNLKHNVIVGGTREGLYVQAVEYNPAVSGEIGVWYINYATNEMYLWNSGTNTYVKDQDAVATKNNFLYETETYFIGKDASEILGFQATLPIVPKTQLLNRYIIGDSLILENILLKPRPSGNEKTISVVVMKSGYSFTKANTKQVIEADLYSGTRYTPTITSNYITIPTAVLNLNRNFALIDEDNLLYIGVNRINFDGTVEDSTNVQTIHFNFIFERSE